MSGNLSDYTNHNTTKLTRHYNFYTFVFLHFFNNLHNFQMLGTTNSTFFKLDVTFSNIASCYAYMIFFVMPTFFTEKGLVKKFVKHFEILHVTILYVIQLIDTDH